jgi:hypothetical protein
MNVFAGTDRLTIEKQVATRHRICVPDPRAIARNVGFLGPREQRGTVRAELPGHCKLRQDLRATEPKGGHISARARLAAQRKEGKMGPHT